MTAGKFFGYLGLFAGGVYVGLTFREFFHGNVEKAVENVKKARMDRDFENFREQEKEWENMERQAREAYNKTFGYTTADAYGTAGDTS